MRPVARLVPLLLIVAAWLAACGTPAPVPAEGTPPTAPPLVAPDDGPPPWPQAAGEVLGRSDKLLIYRPRAGDLLAAVAARFLGQTDRQWQIAEANALPPGTTVLTAGQPLIVPLQPANAIGVRANEFQTVPILCYHRFGTGNNKMLMAPTNFGQQLDWLARNGYKVIRLSQLLGFLGGHEPLPQKSVVITIDDGYESVHRHAFPLLKKYGFPATLFVYTDFIGTGDGLSWGQLLEMANSGLVDIQAHSKTHRNLVERLPGESDERYRQNIEAELRVPRELLEKRLAQARVQVRHFAYPFGDASDVVLDTMARQQYQLGVTVYPGGNGFFSQPTMLRRTMIFGDLDLEGFKGKLQTSRSLGAP